MPTAFPSIRCLTTWGRLTSRAYPDTGSEAFVYSTKGLIFYTNQLTKVTGYGFDAARRKTSETNADNQVTQFAYDPADNLTNLVDGLSHKTSWTYSQYGWLTNNLDNNGNPIIIYNYDADGRLTNRWMVGTNNTGFAYDNVGNLTSIVLERATAHDQLCVRCPEPADQHD